MRASGEIGALPALLCFIMFGGVGLCFVSLNSRPTADRNVFVPAAQSEPPEEAVVVAREYLFRPEAPEVGVNVVKEIHLRPPATDAEAAEWLRNEEMVTVEPGTPVKRVKGPASGFCVSVEVVEGPRKGLSGWVWQDCLHDQPL